MITFALLTWCTVIAGPAQAEAATNVAAIDEALNRAAVWLIDRQNEDGSWLSETYGAMKEGPTLTPHVLSTLFFLSRHHDEAGKAFDRGVAYLMDQVEDGEIRRGPTGFLFPAYTAASASRVVTLKVRTPAHVAVRDVYLAHLLDLRLGSELGWSPEDDAFGGWGCSVLPPRKPARPEYVSGYMASNLSATIFGIAALRSADVGLNDPIYDEILLFVERCQNYAGDGSRADPRFDDGGFHFMPQDEALNKPGAAGVDRQGRLRFHSYGSATADGLRALVRCGLPPEHPRVVAARGWLERHFDPARNPGTFADDREVIRESLYYYYVWATAHAFMAVDARTIETDDGVVNWAEALSAELIRRQRPDGSWGNAFTAAKEDDPLVSTPLAAAALAICRHTIALPSRLGEEQPSCQAREHRPVKLAFSELDMNRE